MKRYLLIVLCLVLPGIRAAAQEEPMQEAVEVPDRWSIDVPYYVLNEPGFFYDPYHQNILKGDMPIIGQNIFLVLTGRTDTLVEARDLPTPSGVSTFRAGKPGFFGDGEQFVANQLFLGTVELFKGETAFRPRDWELRFTGAVNLNFVDIDENVVQADVRRGTNRYDQAAALQEALAEYHLADVSDVYDFISVRVGIQPFTSDFRGLLFSDTNLGARLFGTALANRLQWNLMAFDQLEKDTNSDLNTFFRRGQQVYIANTYFQDLFVLGYTAQASVHVSRDDASVQYDDNGFLVRPDPIGSVKAHDVDAVYLGWTGDGHFDRFNLTHALYWATGEDELNPLAGRAVEINALLGAFEGSIDFDWLRVRGSFLYASGDRHPTDRSATGFDSIFEGANFAGGPLSFWNRQNVRIGGVNLTNRLSQLPDLRSSKTQGQLNFVNPGLLLYNAGVDVEITPELKAVANASYMRFDHTNSLEILVNQPGISPTLGWDASLALIARPFLNNNMTVTVGGSGFFPGEGFTQVFESDDTLYSAFFQLTLVY